MVAIATPGVKSGPSKESGAKPGKKSSEPPSKKTDRLSNAELFFLIALASWAMLFGAFILSYLLARVKTPLWPPPEIAAFPKFLPAVSTLTLAVSSVLITKAFTAWKNSEQAKSYLSDFKFYWGLAILLGVFFGVLQYIALSGWMAELAHSGTRYASVKSHVYSSSVAFLIIFHGIHYVGGLAGLIWKFFAPGNTQSLRLWSWFWHFLGVVWLAIFLAVVL